MVTTPYTTTGDFLAKVQHNSNASGKNGIINWFMIAGGQVTLLLDVKRLWVGFGSASGYSGPDLVIGQGSYGVGALTTRKDHFGNVRATIDGSGLDVTRFKRLLRRCKWYY